ncbi:MAG: collagenase [Gemmatimonadota bacterium]|nr:collagenase [Gemmatimonadota bacterium]
MALLVALSTGLAEATVTGESLPAPLCSRDTTSPEQEWSSLRPAAKAVAQASECPSVDVAALTGNALIDYIRTTAEGCLARTLHISSNPSIRADVPTIFSNPNMQSVLAKIEELAAGYDGTNRTGMLQLWFFVENGYGYHRFFPGTGVGPFNSTTDRAYLAASDAFAASDHFYAPNDEAAQILYYYFEAAFAAGLRRNHLAPIKKVLSGFTPERAGGGTSAPQPWAFITVLRRVHGAFENQNEGLILHQNFMDALAQDPEFVEVMLQVTRYDFFFFLEESDSFTYRLRLLETAIKILVRFTHLDSLKEAAISALTSVLSEHPRLSSPFLAVARALENQVDCASLNICRDVLEREILAQAVPKTYRFDDGAVVFQTSLDLEKKKVQLWYYAAKEVQAQFHRLVETDEVVRDDVDVFTARIYGTKLDYTIFEAYLSYADTRGIHSSGFYSGGIIRTFIHNQPGDRTTYGVGSFEETIRHEYAHYLADRFGLNGGPWFDEGLAEFLVGSTQAEGTPVRPTQVRYIASDEFRLDPAGLFNSRYSGGLGGGHFYYYADLFFHFMHQQRRTQLLELFDLLCSGDHTAYRARVRTWAADSQLAADFDAFLDEQIANVSWGIGSTPTYVPQTTSLTSDSPAEIESALQRINSDLGLRCQTVATGLSPRFGCAGTLPAGSEFSGDQGELSSEAQGESSLFDLFDAFADQVAQASEGRGELNEHLNTRLDSFIVAAIEDGAINNFNAMNCYFANVAGSPPVADLYCEGPLRPADVDWVPPQVDLKAILTSFSGGSSAYVGERLGLGVALDFPEEAASNVIVTWTASLPVTKLNVVSSGHCEVVERTERKGVLACGTVYNENDEWPLTLSLYLTPLQAGSLDFSIEFSADESEVESADNIASMQWTISRESQHIDTLSDHTSWVSSVAFSPDGTTLASGSGDSTVKLWNLATKANTATLSDHTSWVSSVAFSPDGTLAAGLEDGSVKLWNLATKTNTATLKGGSRVNSVAFSPDGTLAAGLEDGSVKLWNLATKTNTNTLSWDTNRVNSVAFSPDGTLAAGLGNSSSESNHAVVKLWNVATKNIVTLSGHKGHVNSVAFSPDGTTVASGAGDGSGVRLWNVATETSTTLDVRWQVGSVAFSPDGATLAVATSDNGTVQLWDVATKTNIATFSGHTAWVNSVEFSPDGTMLASASNDKTIQLWDVAEWKRAKRLARAEEQIGQPDGPQLAQNAPNPFNSQTVLSYFLYAPGPARLEVFSLTGQRVAVLHQGPQQAGYHRLRWDALDDSGRPVASGVYLYRLVTDEGMLTRKLMLLR